MSLAILFSAICGIVLVLVCAAKTQSLLCYYLIINVLIIPSPLSLYHAVGEANINSRVHSELPTALLNF